MTRGFAMLPALAVALCALASCSWISQRPQVELPKFEPRNRLDAVLEGYGNKAVGRELGKLVAEDSVSVLRDLFPPGTPQSAITTIHETGGSSCVTSDLPAPVDMRCRYCAVRYDIVYDWGWKIQKMIAFWETRYRLDEPVDDQSSVAENVVQGIEVTVRIGGGEATDEGATESAERSCTKFIKLADSYVDTGCVQQPTSSIEMGSLIVGLWHLGDDWLDSTKLILESDHQAITSGKVLLQSVAFGPARRFDFRRCDAMSLP